MRHVNRMLGLGCALAISFAPVRDAAATVIVQDTDIVAGEYVFTMNFSTLFSQFAASRGR